MEWLALVHHCDGFGMHSQEPVQAEATLQDLHHSGENEPCMWWAKFECKMNSACSAIRRGTNNVIDEPTKIRNSLSEIKDPSLDHVHSSINREVAKDPNYTHLDAMKELKREVLWKHPNAWLTRRAFSSASQALGCFRRISVFNAPMASRQLWFGSFAASLLMPECM